MTDARKANLAKWLDTINHHELPGCNWLLFPRTGQSGAGFGGHALRYAKGRRRYGRGGQMVRGRRLVLRWPGRHQATEGLLQPLGHPVLHGAVQRVRRQAGPARAALYRDRATKFGRQFARWFDANGAALPFGRSLTYRIGQSAFYSACIWAGLEPLPLPVMKGIIVRNLNWWLAKPIFDRDGVLTIGYGYPQQYMAEQYNAPRQPLLGTEGVPAAGPAGRSPLLDCRGRTPARGTGRAGCRQPALFRPAVAAPAGRPAECLLSRQLREGRPRPVCGKVRQVRLQHSVRLLRQPQLCAAGAGRSGQHAGLRH